MDKKIIDFFKDNADEKYKKFNLSLVNVKGTLAFGVRVPLVKQLAKELVASKDFNEFLTENHTYFEEFMLHGLILGFLKVGSDFSLKKIIEKVDAFLPMINNWAVCDSFCGNLKIVKKNREEFLPYIKKWLKSNHEFVVRTAINLLMDYYLVDDYIDEVISLTKNIKSDLYYINMALAWLYSVVLVKYFDLGIELFKTQNFNKFVHNKTLQKARESFRIDGSKKDYLNSLKI